MLVKRAPPWRNLGLRQLPAMFSSSGSPPVTVGPAIGRLGFPLGFGAEAEDRNLAAAARVVFDKGVDSVKLLRIEVKVNHVLSMRGLGGASTMAQLLEEIPGQQRVVKEAMEAGNRQQLWGKLFNVGTEKQVANLTEEDIGATVLFIQSKALRINMPISIAATFYHSHRHQQPDVPLGRILDADAPP